MALKLVPPIKRRLNYKFEEHRILTAATRYKTMAWPWSPAPLPVAVDLRAMCPPVYDQGDMGSCSGQAIAGAVDFLQLQELKSGGPQVYDAGKFEPCSRMFIYHCERAIEGTLDSDAGATNLKDGCIAVSSTGVCRETLFPYSDDTLYAAPSKAAVGDANKHKVPLYYGLESEYQIKHCLTAGFPVAFGVQVFSAMQSAECLETGILAMPGSHEDPEGGHALVAVGYSDLDNMYWVRNSWGADWALKGYFKMPYSYMRRYADDFYTLRLTA